MSVTSKLFDFIHIYVIAEPLVSFDFPEISFMQLQFGFANFYKIYGVSDNPTKMLYKFTFSGLKILWFKKIYISSCICESNVSHCVLSLQLTQFGFFFIVRLLLFTIVLSQLK